MAQNVCVSRLDALRKAMEKNGIDVYMIPTADFHGSEYVADYFKVREYFSGFTGENATLVVTKDEADLWVDGRFFIQAEHELEGSGIIEQTAWESRACRHCTNFSAKQCGTVKPSASMAGV